jgi:Trypsin-co-occurring domain 2
VQVGENGVPVQDLVASVKDSIKTASISTVDAGRDLRVSSVRLILETIATRSAGGALDFRVPFIGFQVKLGGKLSRQRVHEIDISLIPPESSLDEGLRAGDLDSALADAIETVRVTLAAAANGDDPFQLDESTVKIAFGVTEEGDISIGVNGTLEDEINQTLILTIVPVQ